jgi:Na+/H+ antiporter NhaC
MRAAERRVNEGGGLVREGAAPLINDSGLPEEAVEGWGPLTAYLFVPIGIVLGLAMGSFLVTGSILIAEAFILATAYLAVTLMITRRIDHLGELVEYALAGIRNVLPALIIIALAYALNTVTDELGAATWLVSLADSFLTPGLLVAVTFVLAAAVSFSTGTSWGTFALIMPLALPVALAFGQSPSDPIVLETIAAVTGGGIFGDHTSPVSDTSVLSSAGAGSDHMDHIITQLPYALVVAAITTALYLIL